MLKTFVGAPECENQAIHTTHSAQLIKLHGATFPLNTTNTQSR